SVNIGKGGGRHAFRGLARKSAAPAIAPLAMAAPAGLTAAPTGYAQSYSRSGGSPRAAPVPSAAPMQCAPIAYAAVPGAYSFGSVGGRSAPTPPPPPPSAELSKLGKCISDRPSPDPSPLPPYAPHETLAEGGSFDNYL